MLKTITLIALATFAFSGEADAKKPSFAEEVYNKAIEANSKDAFKAYQAYQDSLTKANEKIVKALEVVKKDLNDTKKGSLSLTERADAIKEIDGKIAELKKGALGELVVAKSVDSSNDLLGENSQVLMNKTLISFIKENPKWKMNDTDILVFDVKNMKASIINADKVLYTSNIIVEKSVVKFATNVIDFTSPNKVTFRWQGGNTIVITQVLE